MSVDERFERYRELQSYVSWAEDDARRVAAVAGLLEPSLAGIIDDFYATIAAHAATQAVIIGGRAQVERLKLTLLNWLRELLSGRYDRDYVTRRWQVGRRHVELEFNQVYTNAALSRIRIGLLGALHARWQGDPPALLATSLSLNKLLDLDLALIEDAYQTEYALRRQRIERLATIGQMAGGVAHELRNPLNVIKTTVYYLLNAPVAAPEEMTEHLRRIERYVDLADGVITALSSFARMPSSEARVLPVADCVREALEVNPVPPSVELCVDLPDNLPPVSADARQLQIVFGNLIRNARDAMPQGGRITVTGRADPDGKAVAVQVADNGVGIPPEDLQRIMEPLYTTKARGLGLGLAIVRTILDKNGGELHVASAPGCGSTFTVRLSAAPAGDGHEAGTP